MSFGYGADINGAIHERRANLNRRITKNTACQEVIAAYGKSARSRNEIPKTVSVLMFIGRTIKSLAPAAIFDEDIAGLIGEIPEPIGAAGMLRHLAVVGSGVIVYSLTKTVQVTRTLKAHRSLPGGIQSWNKDADQDGNDAYNDEQLHERKTMR